MNPTEIKVLLSSPAGKDLQKFLYLKATELDSIHNIPIETPIKDMNLETRARQLAYNKLIEILEQIMNLSEVKKQVEKEKFHYLP